MLDPQFIIGKRESYLQEIRDLRSEIEDREGRIRDRETRLSIIEEWIAELGINSPRQSSNESQDVTSPVVPLLSKESDRVQRQQDSTNELVLDTRVEDSIQHQEQSESEDDDPRESRGKYSGLTTRQVAIQIMLQAPRHTLSLDEVIHRAARENYEIKKSTLQSLFSRSKNYFASVDPGRGIWRLRKSAIAHGGESPAAMANHTPSVAPQTNLKPFFHQNELRGMAQAAALTLIVQRLHDRGQSSVVFNLTDALEVMAWVGTPPGGATEHNQRVNMSKLLQLNPLVVGFGRGQFGLAKLPEAHPAQKPQEVLSLDTMREVERREGSNFESSSMQADRNGMADTLYGQGERQL